MKKLLSLGVFLLFFGVTQATPPDPWSGTYDCFKATYRSFLGVTTKEVALELKFIRFGKDSLFTLRNTITRRLQVFKLVRELGQHHYEILDTAGKSKATLVLHQGKEKLEAVSILSAEGSAYLTIFYPLYRKV